MGSGERYQIPVFVIGPGPRADTAVCLACIAHTDTCKWVFLKVKQINAALSEVGVNGIYDSNRPEDYTISVHKTPLKFQTLEKRHCGKKFQIVK